MTLLKYERLARGLAQQDLAAHAGIPTPLVAAIEERSMAPLPTHLMRLSDALGIPEGLLLTEVDA